ncbi:MAG: carbon monoxide dehydrogenase subunit G [Geminicoccaceae bacterium]
MDMTGEYRIPAPRDVVWDALNDPDVLKESITGCEEMTKVSDTHLHAQVTAKVGPVKAKFGGDVNLEDLNPPESYTLVGSGKGAAGVAKGRAHVNLQPDGEGTLLTYSAHADVGGKLAQLGARLVQGTAKKMADEFFSKFSSIVGERYAASPAGVAAAAAAPGAAGEATTAQVPPPSAAPAEPPKPGAPTPVSESESKGMSKLLIYVGIGLAVVALLIALLG